MKIVISHTSCFSQSQVFSLLEVCEAQLKQQALVQTLFSVSTSLSTINSTASSSNKKLFLF